MRSCRSLARRSVGIAVLVASVLQGAAAQPGDKLPVMLKGQDRLECILPNGDKFILIRSFDYDAAPLVFVHPHVQMRSNISPWQAFYKPKHGALAKTPVDEGHYDDSEHLSDVRVRRQLCSDFWAVRGNVLARSTVLFPGATDFVEVLPTVWRFPEALQLTLTPEEERQRRTISSEGNDAAAERAIRFRRAAQAAKLTAHGIDGQKYRPVTTAPLLVQRSGALLRELPFETPSDTCEVSETCPITAVWQANWSCPIAWCRSTARTG